MAETPKINPAGPDPIRAAQPAQFAKVAPKKLDDARAAAPAFRVLLDRLTSRADELAKKSQAAEDPEKLPGAVDAARASLEDALSLSEKLLEAYRQAQRESGAQPEPKP